MDVSGCDRSLRVGNARSERSSKREDWSMVSGDYRVLGLWLT